MDSVALSGWQREAVSGAPVQSGVGAAHTPTPSPAEPSLCRSQGRSSPEGGECAPGGGSLGLSLIATKETFSARLGWGVPGQSVPVGDPKKRRVSIMSHGVVRAAHLHEQGLIAEGVKYKAALLTFTYAPGVDWSGGHVRYAIQCLRKWCARRGFVARGVWVLELHKSGRPHYHLVLFVPRGITPPMFDKQGWWKHGMSNAKWARSPVGYIAKYASKGVSGALYGDLPKGARLWGHFGLSAAQRELMRFWRSPMWLRSMADEGDRLRRTSSPDDGVWYVNESKGVRYRNPWSLDLARGELRCRALTTDDVEFVGGV